MIPEIVSYNKKQQPDELSICNMLSNLIDSEFTESKVWHAHPVWFIDGNPIVGYSKQKPGIRFMFWSGADFEEEKLIPGTGKFKDASVFYTSVSQINEKEIKRWLKKAKHIQWDYKNLIKRKGKLEKINTADLSFRIK